MFVSMCFKIISKVVKYTCRLRRYNYTHDQLNTRHYIRIFLGFFLRGGPQNSSLPPGARYPRYATVQFTLLWYTKYNKYFEISQYGDSMACESIIHIDTLTHSLVAFCHLQTDIDNTIYYNPVKKTIVFSIY